VGREGELEFIVRILVEWEEQGFEKEQERKERV